MGLRREASPMHVCAWCDCELGICMGAVRGVPTTNYGMCPDCLARRRLALLSARPQTADELECDGPEALKELHAAA
jgi:hypothetical protein